MTAPANSRAAWEEAHALAAAIPYALTEGFKRDLKVQLLSALRTALEA